jgi:hypothetical protein
VMASQTLFVALDLGEGLMAQASAKRPNVTPRREVGRSCGGSSLDEGVSAADLDLVRCQTIGGEACPDVDRLAHQHFAA